MSNSKLSQSDYRLLAEFRFLLRRFMAFSEKAGRADGLAPQQHQALLAIKGFSKGKLPAIGDLAYRLGIRHHSAVELIDRLETAGLVKRQDDPTDARKVAIALTAAAENSLARLASTHREELRRLAPVLAELLVKIEDAND